MNWVELLTELDPADAKALVAFYDLYQCDERFLDQLVAALDSPSNDSASAWLIKHAVEQGAQLSASQSADIIQQLQHLEHWQAKLPLLQVFAFLTVSNVDAQKVFECLHRWLSDKNTFVRAWSYHGLVILADRRPDWRTEVGDWVALAMQDEKASVKARLRQLKQQYSWMTRQT